MECTCIWQRLRIIIRQWKCHLNAQTVLYLSWSHISDDNFNLLATMAHYYFVFSFLSPTEWQFRLLHTIWLMVEEIIFCYINYSIKKKPALWITCIKLQSQISLILIKWIYRLKMLYFLLFGTIFRSMNLFLTFFFHIDIHPHMSSFFWKQTFSNAQHPDFCTQSG